MPPRSVPVDPRADFTAHSEHRGLVIDRSTDGRQALVTPGHSLPFTSGPDLVVESEGKTVAGLWQHDLDHIAVRRSQDEAAPVVGRVESTWKDGVLRLRIQSTDGVTYTTSRFHRGNGRAPDALGLYAETDLDVDGVYRAEVRAPDGRPVGWLRLEVDPSRRASHIYQGDLPNSLDPAVASAAVTLLEANLDEIESRATDVHLGD